MMTGTAGHPRDGQHWKISPVAPYKFVGGFLTSSKGNNLVVNIALPAMQFKEAKIARQDEATSNAYRNIIAGSSLGE